MIKVLIVFAFFYLLIGHMIAGGSIPSPGEDTLSNSWKAYFRNWKYAIIWPNYLVGV